MKLQALIPLCLALAQASASLSCTPEEATAQMEHWRINMDPRTRSACTNHKWLPRIQAMQRPHGQHVLIDIGCNTGYHSAEMFDIFAPELNINKRALYDHHYPISTTDSPKCPQACAEDCGTVSETPYLMQGGREVVVHCLEPSNVHWASLNKARSGLFKEPVRGDIQGNASAKTVGYTTGIWRMYNMAVSDTPGTAVFTKDCSSELCSIEGNATQVDTTQYQVKVTSVDELMSNIGSPEHVVFMKIDTEGFDPSVLEGAKLTLGRKIVSVIVFEYNRMNQWTTVKLKDVVAGLQNQGYSCYFDDQPRLFKISHGCWHDGYENKVWSNIVCGVANTPVELVLDGFSHLRQMKAKVASSSRVAVSPVPPVLTQQQWHKHHT